MKKLLCIIMSLLLIVAIGTMLYFNLGITEGNMSNPIDPNGWPVPDISEGELNHWPVPDIS